MSILKHIEPESHFHFAGSPDRAYVASIAVSLRRIADALDREAEGGAAGNPLLADGDGAFVEAPRTRRAKITPANAAQPQ